MNAVAYAGFEGIIQQDSFLKRCKQWDVKAIRISPFGGDWFDLRFDWLRQREISPAGAILVRPDRHVAWRSFGARENPRDA